MNLRVWGVVLFCFVEGATASVPAGGPNFLSARGAGAASPVGAALAVVVENEELRRLLSLSQQKNSQLEARLSSCEVALWQCENALRESQQALSHSHRGVGELRYDNRRLELACESWKEKHRQLSADYFYLQTVAPGSLPFPLAMVAAIWKPNCETRRKTRRGVRNKGGLASSAGQGDSLPQVKDSEVKDSEVEDEMENDVFDWDSFQTEVRSSLSSAENSGAQEQG